MSEAVPFSIEDFFRREGSRLQATVLRELGTGQFAAAEDIAQEALLRALRAWSLGGIPENPAAWITRVAINLARDHGRHLGMRQRKEESLVLHQTLTASPAVAWESTQTFRDDMLRLLFICCHPSLGSEAQVMLALKTLCGLNVRQIARAFHRSEAAVEKILSRTKQRVQELALPFALPAVEELAARLDHVLDTLYLMFNEGYQATEGDEPIRFELCAEALRLTRIVAQHPAGDRPRTHALLSLLLLTAARLPARTDATGALLRLEEQDRGRWRTDWIDEGLCELQRAQTGTQLTDYHLQAGIAALHCLASSRAETDWASIVRHYDQLWALTASPVVALNRAVALAEKDGPLAGLAAVKAIPSPERLAQNHLFHAVLGTLHGQLGHAEEAKFHHETAVRLCRVQREVDLLQRTQSDGIAQ